MSEEKLKEIGKISALLMLVIVGIFDVYYNGGDQLVIFTIIGIISGYLGVRIQQPEGKK